MDRRLHEKRGAREGRDPLGHFDHVARLDRLSSEVFATLPDRMSVYLAVGVGFVIALNLPVVVAQAGARSATSKRGQASGELGAERRAQLEEYVRA